MTVFSPCVKICKLDTRGLCIGCFRTRDEIARWTEMSESERVAVIVGLETRRPEPDRVFKIGSNE
jgi:uncharacterized protein